MSTSYVLKKLLFLCAGTRSVLIIGCNQTLSIVTGIGKEKNSTGTSLTLLSYLFLLTCMPWIHWSTWLYIAVKNEPRMSKNMTEAKKVPTMAWESMQIIVSYSSVKTTVAKCFTNGPFKITKHSKTEPNCFHK